MKNITDDFIFVSRYNLDRVALAIQFLEKGRPDENIKSKMEYWIYQMITQKTMIKEEEEDVQSDRNAIN